MPVWYMVVTVYTSTNQSYRYIPGYTWIYRDVRNRLVLSRWWRFQMTGTRHSPLATPSRPGRSTRRSDSESAHSQLRGSLARALATCHSPGRALAGTGTTRHSPLARAGPASESPSPSRRPTGPAAGSDWHSGSPLAAACGTLATRHWHSPLALAVASGPSPPGRVSSPLATRSHHSPPRRGPHATVTVTGTQ
jgi:hypothetical protein